MARDRLPYGLKACGEVGRIWYSRDSEHKELPKFGMQCFFVTDPRDLDVSDFCRKFWGLLETLTPREEKIIKLRFEHDLTLEEVGDVLGVTRERVRQIEQHAFRKMRSPDRYMKLGINNIKEVFE